MKTKFKAAEVASAESVRVLDARFTEIKRLSKTGHRFVGFNTETGRYEKFNLLAVSEIIEGENEAGIEWPEEQRVADVDYPDEDNG